MSYCPESTPSVLPADLLRRMDEPGPRDTAYPTVDRICESFGPQSYRDALRDRVCGEHLGGMAPLSVDVRTPFCGTVCHHCVCNKADTRHHSRSESCLDCLTREIAPHAEQTGLGQPLWPLRAGRFATKRGLWAGRDDLSRRDVIMALMCHGRVVFRAIKRACPVRERTYFAAEIERLVPFSQERSVGLDNQGIQLTAPGWLFVGGVAMVFDRHLRVDRDHSRPSRIVSRRRLWTLC